MKIEMNIEFNPNEILNLILLLNAVSTTMQIKGDEFGSISDEVSDILVELQAKLIAVMQGAEE